VLAQVFSDELLAVLSGVLVEVLSVVRPHGLLGVIRPGPSGGIQEAGADPGATSVAEFSEDVTGEVLVDFTVPRHGLAGSCPRVLVPVVPRAVAE
jgi:hypothetical protein